MKRASIGRMYCALAMISMAGMGVFAFLLATANEAILMYDELKGLAAGIYWYCACASLPCVAAAILLGAVIREIGQGRAFSMKNAFFMRGIALSAYAESMYIAAGLIGWSVAGIMHISAIFAAIPVILLGVGIGLLADALATLIRRASEIQQENDLTV